MAKARSNRRRIGRKISCNFNLNESIFSAAKLFRPGFSAAAGIRVLPVHKYSYKHIYIYKIKFELIINI